MNKKYLLVNIKKTSKISKLVSKKFKLELLEPKIQRFKDSEIMIKFKKRFRDKKIIILHSIYRPFNECIFELFLIINTIKNLLAKKITLFSFYLAYSRQDKIVYEEKASVAFKLLMQLLSKSGLDHIITFDLHSQQTVNFFDKKFENLSLFPTILEKIRKRKKKFTIVFPDIGCYNRYKLFLKNEVFVVINKTRKKNNKEIINCSISKKDLKKTCIIIDDIVDSGETIIKTSSLIIKKGVRSIYIYAIHPVLSRFRKFEKQINKINAIKKVFFFNTLLKKIKSKKIKFVNFKKEIFKVIKNQLK